MLKQLARAILVIAAVVAAGFLATPARASILGGCVGPFETGVSLAVGWVDVGVMLGASDPEPPALFFVTGPDGAQVEYANGIGLTPPTDLMPVWLAPVSGAGEYQISVGADQSCTIAVELPANLSAEIISAWIAQSAPVTKR